MATHADISAIQLCSAWVQEENLEPIRVDYLPDQTIIDDIKKIICPNRRQEYRGFFRDEYITADSFVPPDTSFKTPIVFKIIKPHRSEYIIPFLMHLSTHLSIFVVSCLFSANEIDSHDMNMEAFMEIQDEARTRIMYSNRDIISKFNQVMQKSRSNCT